MKRDPGQATAAQVLADGYNSLGNVFYKSLHYSEAEHAYAAGLPVVYAAREKPHRLAETEAWLLGGLARVYWVTNRYEQAEDAFGLALAAEDRLLSVGQPDGMALSNHAGTWSDYSMLLHSQGKYHESISKLKQANALEQNMELTPTEPSIRLFLYHHLCLLAREHRAVGDYRACLDTAYEIAEVLPRKLKSSRSRQSMRRMPWNTCRPRALPQPRTCRSTKLLCTIGWTRQ